MILENVNNVQCKVEIVTIGATYEVLDLPDYEPIDENGTIKSGSNLALKIIPLEEMDDTLVLTVTAVRNGIEEEINIDSDICYIHNIVTDITIKIELKYAFNVIMYHIDGDVLTGEYSSESDTELIIPSKPHFIFHGWYDNENYYGEEILILKAGSKWSKVFYGYYEAIVYILSLDVNGGEQLLKTTFEMTFSESGYLLPVPTKIGYEFLGWFSSREGGKAYTDNNGKSYQVWREDGDRTFYAHWQAKKYNITLDANGGEVSQYSIEVTYDQNYTLPIPLKENFIFFGWFTDSTNGIAYTNEFGNSINVWNFNENVKLYAHWNDRYQLNLKNIKEINFNNEKVKYVYIDNKLVWPHVLFPPKVEDIKIVSILSPDNMYLDFEIANLNIFDVYAYYAPLVQSKSVAIGRIAATSNSNVQIPLNQAGSYNYRFYFKFQKEFSDSAYGGAFVAQINYSKDENTELILPSIKYVITNKEPIFDVQAVPKKNAQLYDWILSEGLQEVSRSGNFIKVQVLKQSQFKELTISVKSILLPEPCTSCGTQLSSCECTTSSGGPLCYSCSSNISSGNACNICSAAASSCNPCTAMLSSYVCSDCTANLSQSCSVCATNASACTICMTSKSKSCSGQVSYLPDEDNNRNDFGEEIYDL